ncbi:enoyl-CoA hydratase/isomerase family protein [Variovorax sp. J22R24]|uniref:enoyl-CoA hydratase/isomerase family protein n=1 Tax=Variovorax TaxID=34072 RepID=UPI002575F824|nr:MULTISPECIES: enoyl-CoA hydratase/isomerase family protein [unclassified Variovorax]MDM0050468.1 enoyl-CoA hydratase/isomerase family protein [Variovorax sp. J22R115]MDM0110135.1 enoyl-CoA hydratase/isomerase family protein [Variovorax sp. J22R24]
MNDDILLFEALGPVARITLNRPRAMNALNLATLAELERGLADIARNDEIRVLVITGNGPAFCAGADLKEVLAGADLAPGEADFLDRANVVFGALRAFPKPVIAALNGVTMAGGLELAMCADIVVAAESATIADAHANFGVFPGAGGAAILPRLIPLNMAMYLLMTGKSLSAAEMKACGLVCEVHPDASLAEATLVLARHIAQKSPIALRRMKQVARASADKTGTDALLHEQVMLRQHMRTADFHEGLTAFAEKRAPNFPGR